MRINVRGNKKKLEKLEALLSVPRHNERYELESVQDQSPRFTYQYDLAGNRLTSNEEGENSTYTPNTLNQYSSVNGQNYQYDLKGNLTSDGVNAYAYDYENRLVSVIASGSEAIYSYDPFGRRLAKTINNESTLFIHDQDQILESHSCDQTLSNCTLNQSFIYSNRIDEPLQLTNHLIPIPPTERDTTQTQIGDYYYHHDALGNTVAITDKLAELTELIQYDPYGQPHFFNPEGESIPESTVNNPYLWTGREWDQETKRYHYRRRAYDPFLGRFMQRDSYTWGPDDKRLLSVALPQSFERQLLLYIGGSRPSLQIPYLYAINNPVNYTDPSGNNAVTLGLITIILGISFFLLSDAAKKFEHSGELHNQAIQAASEGNSISACKFELQFQSSFPEAQRALYTAATVVPGTSLTGPPPTDLLNALSALIQQLVSLIKK